MKFNWPSQPNAAFGKTLLKGQHDGAGHIMFTDVGLADLLDTYPRARLGIYTFPEHTEGQVKALHGRAPDLNGAELVEAVKAGHIWLNLRAANEFIPAYASIADELFTSVEEAYGARTFKRDVGVLISSPNVHVHYHLDIPLVCLVQLRGEKTLYLYPAEAPFASDEQIEAIVLREQDEEVVFQSDFESHASIVRLQPGQMVTWPQNAPHRVQNGDMLNVSLSCEFLTPTAFIRANAFYTNGLMRRKLGQSPRIEGGTATSRLLKAGLARGMKLIHKLPQKSPTPVTFEIRDRFGTLHPVDAGEPESPAQAGTYSYKIKPVHELTNEEIADWRTLAQANQMFRSPLLSPDFAKLIGTVRDDVHVLQAMEGDALIAAMALHVRGFGHARPVGAPFDDYSGPIVADGHKLDLAMMLKRAGLHSYRARASVATPEHLTASAAEIGPVEHSYVMDLSDCTPEEYLEVRRSAHPKRFKNFRRLRRKLARDYGEVKLEWGMPKRSDLEQLFLWKSRQFQNDGLVDITQATQSRKVLNVVASQDPSLHGGFGGMMVSLKVNNRIIAAHFGVRNAGHFHPWIAAYDPQYSSYAPGILLLLFAVEHMPEMQLATYDLASGHEHYKKYFAAPYCALNEINAARSTVKGQYQAISYQAWECLGARTETSVAARLRRRLDHIAACEPGFFARAYEVGLAVARRR